MADMPDESYREGVKFTTSSLMTKRCPLLPSLSDLILSKYQLEDIDNWRGVGVIRGKYKVIPILNVNNSNALVVDDENDYQYFLDYDVLNSHLFKSNSFHEVKYNVYSNNSGGDLLRLYSVTQPTGFSKVISVNYSSLLDSNIFKILAQIFIEIFQLTKGDENGEGDVGEFGMQDNNTSVLIGIEKQTLYFYVHRSVDGIRDELGDFNEILINTEMSTKVTLGPVDLKTKIQRPKVQMTEEGPKRASIISIDTAKINKIDFSSSLRHTHVSEGYTGMLYKIQATENDWKVFVTKPYTGSLPLRYISRRLVLCLLLWDGTDALKWIEHGAFADYWKLYIANEVHLPATKTRVKLYNHIPSQIVTYLLTNPFWLNTLVWIKLM